MEIRLQGFLKTHRNVSIRLIVLCLALFSLVGCDKNSAIHDDNESLSVELDTNGYHFRQSLKVDPSGRAEVKDSIGDTTPRVFQVSVDQLNALRQALEAERFFDLKEVYGDRVPDGGEARLKVTLGRTSQTVTLLFLGNWDRNGHAKLAEARRAARVLDLVEGWRRERGSSD